MSSAAGPDPRAGAFSNLLLPVGDQPQNGASQREPEVLAGRADLRGEPASDLLKQVSAEASTLLRQELTLAKAEMSEKAKEAGIGAGMVGGAGYTLHLASFGLMLCFIFALATAMAAWLAALIVTVVFVAIAAVLAMVGKKRIQKAGPPVPEEAIESVKQTVQSVKEEAKWGLGQTS
jgi:Flp pilus assembly protein TadB